MKPERIKLKFDEEKRTYGPKANIEKIFPGCIIETDRGLELVIKVSEEGVDSLFQDIASHKMMQGFYTNYKNSLGLLSSIIINKDNKNYEEYERKLKEGNLWK